MSLINDICDQRNNIRRIKDQLCTWGQSVENLPDDEPQFVKITVVVEGDIKQFDTVEQDRLIGILTQMTNTTRDQIRILNTECGSVKITLELPEYAARHLVSLFEQGAIGLQQLSILRIAFLDTDTLLTRTEQPESTNHPSFEHQRSTYGRSSHMAQYFPDRSNDDWIVSLRAREPQICTDLYHICLSVAKRCLQNWNGQEPSDAASEIWVKLVEWVDQRDFKVNRSFERYVIVATSNHCYNIKRVIYTERSQFSDPIDENTEYRASFDVGSNDTTDPARVALYAALDQCMKRCTQEDQQIAQWYAERKGPAWIAKQLRPATRQNTISVRWYRIRAKVRDCMERLGQNPLKST